MVFVVFHVISSSNGPIMYIIEVHGYWCVFVDIVLDCGECVISEYIFIDSFYKIILSFYVSSVFSRSHCCKCLKRMSAILVPMAMG